jgi:hypothetical protein
MRNADVPEAPEANASAYWISSDGIRWHMRGGRAARREATWTAVLETAKVRILTLRLCERYIIGAAAQ